MKEKIRICSELGKMIKEDKNLSELERIELIVLKGKIECDIGIHNI